MSTLTINFEFIKPEPEDFYSIDDQNSNMDEIDALLQESVDTIQMIMEGMDFFFTLLEDIDGDVLNNSDTIDEVMDGVIDNAANIDKHEQYTTGVKSGIDLSGGDVTLLSDDYYKGLIEISTAHESYSLILPTVNNHKYTIYNSSSTLSAFIKKSGGTAIEIPTLSAITVVYDGIEYRREGFQSKHQKHSISGVNGNTHSAYPVGITYSKIDSGNSVQSDQTDNSDFASYGTIMTVNVEASSFFQYLNSHNKPGIFVRSYYSGVWQTWRKLDSENISKTAGWTLTLADMQGFITVTSATGVNITVPKDVFPSNIDISFIQGGDGEITLVPVTDVTIKAPEDDTALTSDGKGTAFTIRSKDNNEWRAIGVLKA